MLINLVKTAIKFSLTDEVKIRILACYDCAKSLVKVHVEEYGSGVKSQEKDDILAMFSKSNRRKIIGSEGISLGLSICRSIVE